MEKYRLSPETCVLVGDRKTDVACGKAAGMRTIALLSPATDGDSAADGADGAARSLTEALTVIRRWNADEAAGRKG